MSSEIKCDPKTQYILKDNETGEILSCPRVRNCLAGEEPTIRRGEVIDKHDIIGLCKPCDNGTFSPTLGPQPCEICLGANCLKEHQVAEGMCTATQDTSSCKCKDGYAMNEEGTVCEVYKPQQNITTVPTTEKPTTKKPTKDEPSMDPTTSSLPMKNSTTNNSTNPVSDNQEDKKPVGAIVGSTIAIIIVVVIIIAVWRWKCSNASQGTDSSGGLMFQKLFINDCQL